MGVTVPFSGHGMAAIREYRLTTDPKAFAARCIPCVHRDVTVMSED